jgi:hypothetical protein
MYEKEVEEYNKARDINARVEEEIEQWRKRNLLRNQQSSGTNSSIEEEENVDTDVEYND